MKTTTRAFLLILTTLLLFVCQSVDAQTEEISKLNNALLKAAVKGDALETEALLQAGADVDAISNSGQTALMYAVMRNHIEVVDLLLDAGADVNAKIKSSGATALMYATMHGYTEVMRLLLNAEADLDPSSTVLFRFRRIADN